MMEINDYIIAIKNRYGYSEEMVCFLQKAIPALISYYGEDKKDIIMATFNDNEIHIQGEKENTEEYLNQYFGTEKKWDIPFLGGAFQHTELSVKNNMVSQKNVIYMPTVYFNMYKPFDFNNDDKISDLIHEICHAIKGYGKLRVEDGKVITSTGLSKDHYEYNKNDNTFTIIKSEHTGIEEALNSYDEAAVMTIMTGKYHECGSYQGMTLVARELMNHNELAKVIKTSQFSGNNEWIQFLGKEESSYLSSNFDEWINVLYSSPADLMNDKLGLMEKMQAASKNISDFARNYSTPQEISSFEESQKIADQKTIQIAKQIVYYNSQTNTFEQIKRNMTM